jgi:nitrite reductase/ring-hydroxylating ferredoxin subunit/uncharacterized membrane protein
MKLRDQIDRIEHTTALDPAVDAMAAVASRAVPTSRRARNLLHGTWLGHPLHPALSDAPIGLWAAATVLDLVGGRRARPAAQRLLGAGLLAALPTATAGLADWSALGGEQRARRTGVAHALANGLGMTVLAISYGARRAGRHRVGAALQLAGMACAGAGAYLGGHLAYRQGIGVDRTAVAGGDGVEAWTRAAELASLPQGRPARAEVDGTPLVLVRTGEDVAALSATCSHLGGPLDEGEVVPGPDGRACVQCPWHGSMFDLADGTVVSGPATAPQPDYDTRVVGGWVEVRRRPPGGPTVIDLAEGETAAEGAPGHG